MSGRPFQVGDTVRITDHIKRAKQPDLQHVFEGVVSRIDPKSGPESPYTYAPYLWIDTDPFENASGETFTATFCSMTEDLTDGDHPGQRSIELLEAASEPRRHHQDGGAIEAAAEFQVGIRYMYDGMLVEVTVIDEDRIEFRAVHDQEAIARGWFPTSYDTYEASMSVADFRSMVDGGTS